VRPWSRAGNRAAPAAPGSLQQENARKLLQIGRDHKNFKVFEYSSLQTIRDYALMSLCCQLEVRLRSSSLGRDSLLQNDSCCHCFDLRAGPGFNIYKHYINRIKTCSLQLKDWTPENKFCLARIHALASDSESVTAEPQTRALLPGLHLKFTDSLKFTANESNFQCSPLLPLAAAAQALRQVASACQLPNGRCRLDAGGNFPGPGLSRLQVGILVFVLRST
jgi:hypothetical protein